MKVFIEKDNKTLEVEFKGSVKELLDKLEINSETVLVLSSNEVLTEDEKYKIFPLICKYITIFYNIHEDQIELALFTNNLIMDLATFKM